MTNNESLWGFWLYVIAWAQARYIEQLELKAFCDRNAERRMRCTIMNMKN